VGLQWHAKCSDGKKETITHHQIPAVLVCLRVLGTLFGPKREEVVGGWRKSHGELCL